MQRIDVSFDDAQLRALEHLAAAERLTVDELVRRAVDIYLSQRLVDDAEWHVRLNQFAARIQARVPHNSSPAEIEADITAARAEVKRGFAVGPMKGRGLARNINHLIGPKIGRDAKE